MEVILQEDFPALGYVGDKVSVKRGYARNFLVPRGIAVEVSTVRAKLLEHQMNQILAKKRRLKGLAEEFASTLSEVRLPFKLKVGEKGRSFGSVTSKDIHEALTKAGHSVERKQIRLAEPLKVVGEHVVSVKLHSEVTAEITVEVTAQGVAKKKKKSEEAAEGGEEGQSETSFAEALEEEDRQRTEGSTTADEFDNADVASEESAESEDATKESQSEE